VVLDGQVGRPGPAGPDQPGLAGATVEVHAVDATTGARRGPPLHRQTTGADGRWGPMQTAADAGAGVRHRRARQATLHVYRSAFPRSSSQVVHFRPERLSDADKAAQAVVSFTRPRAYFGLPRDRIDFDGQQPAPAFPPGWPGWRRRA
jgi:triacylglycerol lipase